MAEVKVSEIFYSVDGEGPHTGGLCTFVRFYGCNLRCRYCDSGYACTGGDFELLTTGEIVDRVLSYPRGNVTLTGGEPLLVAELPEIASALAQATDEVWVETNGSVAIPEEVRNTGARFCMDLKSPSSRMYDARHLKNLDSLRSVDTVKLVLSSADIPWAERVLDEIPRNGARVYLSPIFGECDPRELVDLAKRVSRDNSYLRRLLRVQIQLHKAIWPTTTRGV